jgi:diguanylate cyclase (GGDEF)-like protein
VTRYALGGALMSLWVPGGLPIVRALERGDGLSWRAMLSDVASAPAGYVYLVCSTLALMAGLGALLGRWSERANRLAATDPLTGLYNRRHFALQLESEALIDRRRGLPTCVMCVDVDRLKVINDRFGHGRGDLALVEVARVLSQRLRSRDVVARFGGDEFAVLLPDTPASVAADIAERILSELRGTPSALPGGLSVSIGIAELEGVLSAAELMAAADRALYWVKSTGGGKVSVAPRIVVGMPMAVHAAANHGSV